MKKSLILMFCFVLALSACGRPRDEKQSYIDANSVTVFAPEWLLEEAKPLGKQPARTYVGMKFNGGYSDHLPIFLDITLNYK